MASNKATNKNTLPLIVGIVLVLGLVLFFNKSFNSVSTNKISLETKIPDKGLGLLVDQVLPLLEKNKLSETFDFQVPVTVVCGETAFVDPVLCTSRSAGREVEGYQVATYASEGAVTTLESAKETWVNYAKHGPFKFYSHSIQELPNSMKFANLYFSSSKEDKALVLVASEKEGVWVLENSYYGIPLDQIK